MLLHLAINVVFMVSNITILWYHDCYRANIFPTVIENRWSCTNFSDSGNTMSPGKIKICLCVIFMMWSFHLHNVNLYVTQYYKKKFQVISVNHFKIFIARTRLNSSESLACFRKSSDEFTFHWSCWLYIPVYAYI